MTSVTDIDDRSPGQRAGPRGPGFVATCFELLAATAKFAAGGMSIQTLETVESDADRIRFLTLLRMTVLRRREPPRWPYRFRRARYLRTLRGVIPECVWYRCLILPLCALGLARMAYRNVKGFGPRFQERTGRSPFAQFIDIVIICLKYPGALPSDYYVLGVQRAEFARRAPSFANGYDVETVVSLARPTRQLLKGSGFPSEQVDVLNNKDRFRALCHTSGIAVVESLATCVEGSIRWTTSSTFPAHDLFLKPLYGGGGYGAARVFYDRTERTYRVEAPLMQVTRQPYPTTPMCAEELTRWLADLGREVPFVIEPRLKAHPELAALVCDETLPTLRILTVIDTERHADVLHAYLRSAVVDSPVDNVSMGGVAALIDVTTGRLGRAVTNVGEAIPVHPRTGRRLAGFALPWVDAACQQAAELHRAVATVQEVPVPVVGWDVAITEDGPVFIEGNVLSDLATPQKLFGLDFWSNQIFRSSVLSHLATLRGVRLPLDPAADPRLAPSRAQG